MEEEEEVKRLWKREVRDETESIEKRARRSVMSEVADPDGDQKRQRDRQFSRNYQEALQQPVLNTVITLPNSMSITPKKHVQLMQKSIARRRIMLNSSDLHQASS